MADQDPKTRCPHTQMVNYIIAHADSFAHDVEMAEQSLRSGTAKTWEQIQKELDSHK